MSTPIPIFDPEDPKLTAYALGELTDPAERAEVERLLQHSPEAQLAMKEIKDTALVLTAEYDEERRHSLEPADPLTPNIIDLATRLPEPRWGWVRSSSAMAALLLAFGSLAYVSLFGFAVGQRDKNVPPNAVVGAMPNAKRGASTPSASAATTPGNVAELRAKVAMLDQKMTALRKELPEMTVDTAVDRLQEGATHQLESTPTPPAVAMAQTAQKREQDYLGSVSQSVATDEEAETLGAPIQKQMVPALKSAPTFAYQPAPSAVTRSPQPPLSPMPKITAVDTVTVRAVPMKAMTGTATGMGGTGGSGAISADKPVTADQLAKAKAFITANSSAAESTLYNDSRATVLKDVDAVRGDRLAKPLAHNMFRSVGGQLEYNTAAYDHLVENAFLSAKDNPLSTFSIDVDTASYANVRRFIDSGSLPPPDAVRLEELINYFPYDYAPPTADSNKPFAVHLEAAACPWAPEHRLVRIGIKGKEIAQDKRPASNLVFLLDVSGSMQPPERLPLIKRAMQMLTEHLTENDHVAIVTYAGNSGLVLPSTSGDHKDAILNALDRLEAGGSTNGASGITLAYKVAKAAFIKGGTNRVILATDGDFNVGVTSQGDLVRLIQEEAKSGVFLSALGVGTDNFKDSTMQKLADKGNGNYNYLDRIEEARKVLIEQMSGTLLTIAKDVKIQVEFNPSIVGSYRLIGYEKRALKKEDFNNDKIDAGEIGAGHSITALYEVVPVGQTLPGETPAVDALRYAAKAEGAASDDSDKAIVSAATPERGASPEMLTVKMRHKAPDAEQSERTYEVPLVDNGAAGDYAEASPDFKFAAAVASFGLALRDSPYKGGATLGAAVELAQEGKGNDPKGYRAEFIELARRAQALKDAR